MATITIAYTAPVAPAVAEPRAQICATFQPTNAACDLTKDDGSKIFADTYYDTNVFGPEVATSIEEFMAAQVAHPGIIAALRAAANEGFFVYEDASTDDVLYWGEIKPAVEAFGYTVTIESGSGS